MNYNYAAPYGQAPYAQGVFNSYSQSYYSQQPSSQGFYQQPLWPSPSPAPNPYPPSPYPYPNPFPSPFPYPNDPPIITDPKVDAQVMINTFKSYANAPGYDGGMTETNLDAKLESNLAYENQLQDYLGNVSPWDTYTRQAVIQRINQLKTETHTLSFVKDNFATFSKEDVQGKIDLQDIEKIKLSNKTDNNERIFSQVDLEALQNTTNPPPANTPVETSKLFQSIISSDTNNDGQTSRQEISSNVERLNGYKSYYNSLKASRPYWADILDSYIQKIDSQLKPLNLIKENYDAFSDAGKAPDIGITGQPVGDEHQINGASIMHIAQSAESDGNAQDFTSGDLDNLWSKIAQS